MLFRCLEYNGIDIPVMYLDVTRTRNVPNREDMKDTDPEAFYKKLAETRQVYEMHKLYYMITSRLKKMWKGIKEPVITFCLILMSNGTDFFDSPKNVGITTIRDTVLMGGYALLDDVVTITHDDVEGVRGMPSPAV